MSFGFGFGFTKITAAIRAAFSPSSLFAANEPGVWYDPSDLSTLYQDSAGTQPVTAVEQPVGLMLDKSKGLVLGPGLVTNGDFSNGTTGWTLTGAASITGGKLVCNGAFSALQSPVSGDVKLGVTYLVQFDVEYTSGIAAFRLGSSFANAALISSSGRLSYRYTTTLEADRFELTAATSFVGTIDNISVRELLGNHAYQTTATSRPVLSARVNQYLATETLATQNVTTLAAQYRLRFEGTGTITLSGTATGVYLAGSHLITCTAGTLTSTVSGSVTKADLRVDNAGVNLPPYQRVNTATDYDTAGFPHYLYFDGVDDFLVTPTITPGTDKVQVFAGVRKLSDAAYQVITELSANPDATTQSFTFGASTSTGDASRRTWAFGSRGSASLALAGGAVYEAPITNILAGIGDISGDSAILRVDGTQAASHTSDQGTGNYGNHSLYIGRRAGTAAPLSGHLYSLIVRFGPNLPIATIEKTEKYINTKTGAY